MFDNVFKNYCQKSKFKLLNNTLCFFYMKKIANINNIIDFWQSLYKVTYNKQKRGTLNYNLLALVPLGGGVQVEGSANNLRAS